jgi:hypothetical protein
MLSFERALDELSMANGQSFLMNVGTGVGLREWLYYAKDRDRFMKRFNELLAGHEPYPLKIEFYDDPAWKVWVDLHRIYERAGDEGGGGGAGERAERPPPQQVGEQGIASKIREWFRRRPDR